MQSGRSREEHRFARGSSLMRRLGMGLVGPGFVGAHHIDAVRRLGFVDVVALADVDETLARHRGNPMVQQARAMVAAGDAGSVHFVQGAYLQDWLLKPTDFSWRLIPEAGGRSAAFADIGSHWCDLVEHVAGCRIEAVLADLTTVIGTRYRPTHSREAFASDSGPLGEPFRVQSEDLATILLRFEGGATGCVSVGQVCAGHKNDLWFEVNGASASLRWRQEQQNELWIGRRDEPNALIPKDPTLLHPDARAFAHLPGGHQEAWADAFCNVLREIYTFIAAGKTPGDSRPPVFATFEDGYRSACLVEAILESHVRGGVWTNVHATELVGGSR